MINLTETREITCTPWVNRNEERGTKSSACPRAKCCAILRSSLSIFRGFQEAYVVRWFQKDRPPICRGSTAGRYRGTRRFARFARQFGSSGKRWRVERPQGRPALSNRRQERARAFKTNFRRCDARRFGKPDHRPLGQGWPHEARVPLRASGLKRPKPNWWPIIRR